MKSFSSLCFVLVCCGLSSSKNLPSYIKKCPAKYPEINKCLEERISEIKPYLAKGIPELLLPPVDPLIVPKLELDTGVENGGLKLTFTDANVEGLLGYQLKKIDLNLDSKKIDLELFFPKLSIKAIYSANGKLLLLELDSTGPSELNMIDVDIKTHSDAKITKKNGQDYLDISDNIAEFKYKLGNTRFENIFKDNPELSESTNKVINDNIAEIGKDLKPVLDEALRQFCTGLIQRIFEETSLQELFEY